MSELYLRSVRSLLDCPDQERLMKRLSGAVAAYLEEHPGADYEKLVLTFGAPEACAARLLEDCDPALIMAFRRKKNRLTQAVVAILAVLLVLTTCYALYMRATGGTAIIETVHYENGFPDDLPMGQVEYHFDNEEDAG